MACLTIMFTLFTVFSTITTSSNNNNNNTLSEFEEALFSMLELDIYSELNSSYTDEYYEYILSFDKLATGNYILDGNDNYTQLSQYYTAFIDSTILINELNTNYNYSIFDYYNIDYNDINNNSKPYDYSIMSDIPAEYRRCGDSGISDTSSLLTSQCQGIDLDFTRWTDDFEFPDSQCGPISSYEQGNFDTCWALASTNQFQCNYNKRVATADLEFSYCYTILCSGCDNLSSQKTLCAINTFLTTTGSGTPSNTGGVCEEYDYNTGYPACMTNPGTCEVCSQTPTTASSCYYIKDIDLSDRFEAAMNMLGGTTDAPYAMTLSIYTGDAFLNLGSAGKVPITAQDLCDNNPTKDTSELHTMVVVGAFKKMFGGTKVLKVKNSWDATWGDGGYFWLTEDAYKVCAKTSDLADFLWTEFGSSSDSYKLCYCWSLIFSSVISLILCAGVM